ncbi:MAG: class I mannose-6-phosphate isomerase [Mycoplasmatales bacterium]
MKKYDLNPTIKIDGIETVYNKIDNSILKGNLITIECYPGVNINKVIKNISSDYNIIDFSQLYYSNEYINSMIQDVITNDRVFGKMNDFQVNDFIDQQKLEELVQKIQNNCKTIIIGFGSSIVKNADTKILVDITRWEIQLRYRKGLCNLFTNNASDENIVKFKRGYFFDWRIADKLKFDNLKKYDYIFDETDSTMLGLKNENYFKSLNQFYNQPFRLEPYFDPGVWGGNWMKDKLDLPENGSNYAWCFDGVLEENSINISVNGHNINIPGMNLLYYDPMKLVGENVLNKFGVEYPIRFDFLDTMNGQNLSLQVHPLKEYINENFNMKYTQDESYYILDCEENTNVYLGIKEGVDKQELYNSLKEANDSNIIFDDEKYVYQFPVKKHDHFLIPAGTVHCSGSGTMVLEISATPYIFTFKLWDWDRVGLDGKPRPIHIDRGIENINFDMTYDFINDNLVSNFKQLSENEEQIGLYDTQPLEVRRYSTSTSITHKTNNTVHQLNLVEGRELIITSHDNSFAPFIISYVETFIIPANIKEYTIAPHNCNEIKYVLAYVR